MSAFLRTQLCVDFGIEYPILLAGMGVKGRATPPPLVAAVCEAGGMGFLGCSWLDADEVRRRICAVRDLTDRPFGVNLLLPASMADATPERAEMRQSSRISAAVRRWRRSAASFYASSGPLHSARVLRCGRACSGIWRSPLTLVLP